VQIIHSKDVAAAERSEKIARVLETITEAQLREWVERISVPRHYIIEPEANRATANWIHETFTSLGYKVSRQGFYSNVIATPNIDLRKAILVGAHYDSVPNTPGADDNGSAVAAMFGCAAACSLWRPELPIVFVAFNCEEDGLAGSCEFVSQFLPKAPFQIECAHILEMVGYATDEPGSQRIPAGLPIKLSDVGDFLGLLANAASTEFMNHALHNANAYVPQLPVTGLSVRLGLEKFFPVLERSDHAPFWRANIPAVMWTDTSEFRNANYHQQTDTPDTLNYTFLRQVTQLLTASVIARAESN
jgi:Zn-dependent M28 family amino/carboxypeptidase